MYIIILVAGFALLTGTVAVWLHVGGVRSVNRAPALNERDSGSATSSRVHLPVSRFTRSCVRPTHGVIEPDLEADRATVPSTKGGRSRPPAASQPEAANVHVV